ncbi:MAG: Asp23/Gls24 family envelope stress response protein [Finegoldia sp.]|nr:Asp23/Gls24 family envelope stress response protein [Finegoldia sp.]
MNNNFDNGTVKISNDILLLIIAQACSEVEGVSTLVTPLLDKVNADKNLEKAIELEISDNLVNVKVHIGVKDGYNIEEVARKCQEKIKENVGMMTGLSVICVDIVCETINA